MVKLSKASVARLKRMTKNELRAIEKAAVLLADAELISEGRFKAIWRWCGAYQGKKRM